MTRTSSLFDELSLGGRWQPTTRRNHQQAYGLWLAYRAKTAPEALLEPPPQRIMPDHVHSWFLALQSRALAPRTVLHYMITLKVIATSLEPGHAWAWLETAVRRLQAGAHPVRSIVDRLRPVDELFRGALKALADAERRPPRLRTDQSSWFRDALILAILACRAPRHKNLAEMRLGRNLVSEDGYYALRFTADEVKTRKHYEAPLPNALTPWIDRYLSHHRVVLLQGRKTDAVWISNLGRPMHYGSISDQIDRLTKRLFGVQINIHAFRHCTATSTAIKNPAHILDNGPILHNRPETAGRYYNKAKQITALRRHSAMITKLRSTLPRPC